MTRPLIFGICNITPDSFSGDGILNPSRAAEKIEQLFDEGADYVDIGAESTNPIKTEEPLTSRQEIARLEQVLDRILPARTHQISIDSHHWQTVETLAREYGPVFMVNDVTGMNDQNMRRVVGKYGLRCIVSHLPFRYGTHVQEAHRTQYGYPTAQVISDLLGRRRQLIDNYGVDPLNIVLDPGIGFGKTMAQNWQLLRAGGMIKRALIQSGRSEVSVMIGHSRKRFLATDEGNGEPCSNLTDAQSKELRMNPERNLYAARLALEHGADILRVHDPASYLDLRTQFTSR